jgi:hypothetical protein
VFAVFLLSSCAVVVPTLAHHNSQAEYGPISSQIAELEGFIVSVNWGNPHVFIEVEAIADQNEPNERWRVEGDSVATMVANGFVQQDFSVGDFVAIIGWKSLHGRPTILARAIQIDDGPMRSSLRFRDMIDIANKVLENSNIEPAANLNGSPPERAGPDVVRRLHEMGLLNEDGLFIWPP